MPAETFTGGNDALGGKLTVAGSWDVDDELELVTRHGKRGVASWLDRTEVRALVDFLEERLAEKGLTAGQEQGPDA